MTSSPTNFSMFSAFSLSRCTASITMLLMFWISLAVTRLLSASCRISSATTANPFPASPALAASMEAFNARRFVWLAMLKILLVNSSICFTLWLSFTASTSWSPISFIILTAAFRLSTVCSCILLARSLMSMTTSFPSSALWLMFITPCRLSELASASCSMVAEISSMLAANSSITEDTPITLLLEWSISSVAFLTEVSILLDSSCSFRTRSCRATMNPLIPSTNWPISSWLRISILLVRSMWLFSISVTISCNCLSAFLAGRTIVLLVIVKTIPIKTKIMTISAMLNL